MGEQGTVTNSVDLLGEDPLGLVRALEASDRFRRDTPLGGIFHRGEISFREVSPTDSLHVSIRGNRVRAHIDDVSPLNPDPLCHRQYSWYRVLTHNFAGLAADLGRRIRGKHGEQRCGLDCEIVWCDDDEVAEAVTELEQPAALAPVGPGDDDSALELPIRLPFGVIDEAVHLLDCETAPWSIQVEVRVAGSLDEGRLREALAKAVARHPMARARKVPAHPARLRDEWEITGTGDLDALRVVPCPDDAALADARARLQSLAVPLNESPPLRLVLARHPDGDVLMLNANHAAMDGMGALRLMRSVAGAYAGTADSFPLVDFLAARRLPARLGRARPSTHVRRCLALADRSRDVVVPPAHIAPDGASQAAGYGFHHVSLTPEETRLLSHPARESTVNDVLLAAFHLTIAEWNHRHGTPTGRIGVLVPVNLRPPAWRDDVVGNFTLPARVATNPADRRSPDEALEAVTTQTRHKKASGMGTALLEVLGPSRFVPVWAKQAMVTFLPLTGNRLVDTAMLSNLGRVADAPDFGPGAGQVIEMWFSPPARMPLGVSIGAVTTGGRLHLVFRYRPRLFDESAARRFAGLYLDQLARFA